MRYAIAAALALASFKVWNEAKMTQAYDEQARQQKRIADFLESR